MKVVDFYFDYSSTNSYFAAFMLPPICEQAGASIRWLPIHLAALFRHTGFDVTQMHPSKARYLWQDHQRYARFTGLPFKRPSRFPIKTSLALRATVAIPAYLGKPGDYALAQVGSFAQSVFRAYWERDEDVREERVLRRCADQVGLDSDALLRLADEEAARSELARLTAEAEARGVFGAPTFIVGEELFWGKDRLDFVARCLRDET